jgi:hypothetical protein
VSGKSRADLMRGDLNAQAAKKIKLSASEQVSLGREYVYELTDEEMITYGYDPKTFKKTEGGEFSPVSLKSIPPLHLNDNQQMNSHSFVEEQSKPVKKNTKSTKYTDLNTSQSFYIDNDIWDKVAPYNKNRGDRSEMANIAFSLFLKQYPTPQSFQDFLEANQYRRR